MPHVTIRKCTARRGNDNGLVQWHEAKFVLRQGALVPASEHNDADDERKKNSHDGSIPVIRTADLAAGRACLWLAADELRPSGGFGTVVSPRCSVYGLQLRDHHAGSLLTSLQRRLEALDAATGLPTGLTLYHGTDEAAAKGIRGIGAFRESPHGMLGRGVYVGTFWKAARFAARTGSDHVPIAHLRLNAKAIIFRVRLLLDPLEDIALLPDIPKDMPLAPAAVCRQAAYRTAKSKLSQAHGATLAALQHACRDHGSLWRKHGFLAAGIPDPTMTLDTASRKAVVRNAEFCVDAGCVLPLDEGLLDAGTVETTPEGHYMPLSRSQVIV
jgi:hypothetical protein